MSPPAPYRARFKARVRVRVRVIGLGLRHIGIARLYATLSA